MNEKIVVITPQDKIELADYDGYKSMSNCVGGLVERFHKTDLPMMSVFANGDDKVAVDFYCNEEFLVLNDKKFDKINAVASLISGKEIRGDVALVVSCGGGENRGFRYMEEDNGGKVEMAVCECWCIEDVLERYVKENKDVIKDLHKKEDHNKSRPSFEIRTF